MAARVRPFRQFVLKIHSRCDLACDHCYVYRHADQGWRHQPRVMAPQTVRATALRIAEHARAHRLHGVRAVLHGGEPLLVGRDRLRLIARELRSALGEVASLDLRMQTNGLLLDEEWCALLLDERIVVGVSLDGDRVSNDRHRVRADGSGSYDDVVRAVRLLSRPEYRAAFAGLLCTVDVNNDPEAVYRALVDLRPPRIDFLLPHATWDRPPPGPGGAVDYANWLMTVFDIWNAEGRPVPVRMFDSIEAAGAGRTGFTEALGLGSPDLVVVETNGAIEQADWLKTVGSGAAATGFHVRTDSFDTAAAHPGFLARAPGLGALPVPCRRCEVVTVCGGGLYGHRYRSGSGFDNPSVYCAGLLRLIKHVRAADRPPSRHRLPEGDFEALASGGSDAAAVGRLAEAQISLRRSVLAYLHNAGALTGEGWRCLVREEASALDAVLAQPYVRAWAVRCCEALSTGAGDLDTGRVTEMALAAAVRSGRRAELAVPLRSGAVHLPSLGRLTVLDGAVAASGEVTLSVEGGRVRARDVEAAFEPTRYLTAEGVRVAVEDTDPYRNCHVWPPAPRLSQEEFGRWQELFAAAWYIVHRDHPRYVDSLVVGLRAITPLLPVPGRNVSDTSRHAFGAVAVALPETAEDLALLLIHEIQHAKLGALLDMYGLVDPAHEELYEVAWRPDARPAEAVLQGVYAHLAVAEVWRRRTGRKAAEQARHWWSASVAALDAVLVGGGLTPLGLRFATAMRSSAGAGPVLERG
ncbi:FxsB family cyclophane-forming radical SAM/SPASM peptide maturase [Streptomyces pseudovenezuelae]|uniref:FxsB family cyclophane-forming radical SAM/SPASM peptide maturase n=1 Tax=Streptomyces pseudovenezuelae TaxID=67350 RepID=UPI0036E6379C